jgi:hypothetical protein
MWERWDSNPLHGCLTRAGQVVQATIAPLAPPFRLYKGQTRKSVRYIPVAFACHCTKSYRYVLYRLVVTRYRGE